MKGLARERRGWRMAIVAIALALLSSATVAAAEETVLRIGARKDATEILVLTPGAGTDPSSEQAKAKNVVILFNGGSGQVVFVRDKEGPDAGRLKIGGALPITRRQELADRVGATAVLTPPSDHAVMDLAWRDSKEHVTDVAAAITVVQQRFPGAKVWLLGLSNGSWSAAHVGAALQDRLAGVVLMSVGQGAMTSSGFPGIRIPVLVVQHRRDDCLPYADMEADARWYTFITVDDDRLPRPSRTRRDCVSNGAHNFHGSEGPVMAAVAEWINTGKAPAFIDAESGTSH